MNYEQAKDLIRGPLVAMATPFKDNLDLDTDGLQHTVRLLIERGIVRGRGTLLVAAAAGEFPTMNREERMDAMRAAVEAAQGRVPILTSVQHTDIREIIALAKFADEIGITALQLGPTYYYHAPHDDMLRVFRTVGDAVKDVGIMIYNTCWNQPHMGAEMLSQPRRARMSAPVVGTILMGGDERLAAQVLRERTAQPGSELVVIECWIVVL